MYIINTLMKDVFVGRFGFLVNEIGRLYSQQFDRLARQNLGLTQAHCRVLAVLARHDEALSQAELAQEMGLTPMAVAGLCDRMAEAGWIERRPQAGDRRVNRLHMKPSARKALERALGIGDELTGQALAGLGAAERDQLVRLLGKARAGLLRLDGREDT
jgi:DNA-binding MarR family transcriptional regulator